MAALVNLQSAVKFREVDGNNNPLVGGKLFTYQSGTVIKQNTYTDATGVTPNTNPVILDARGEASVWPDVTLTYKYTLAPANDTDPPTNAIWTIDGVPPQPSSLNLASTAVATAGAGLIGFNYALAYVVGTIGRWLQDLALSAGSTFIGFIQAGAGAILRTVQSKGRDIFNSADYGTLQQAVTAAAGRTLVISGVWTVTAAVVLPSDIEIVGDPGAKVTTATPDISLFQATGQSNIRIRGLKFEQTVAGTAAYVGAVSLDTCTRVTVSDCEFVGMQWAGVYLKSTNYSIVRDNRFTAFTGTVQDSADVCVYANSSYNVIDSNYCLGGNWHGILVQDPYAGTAPLKNILSNNHVGQHKAYGIIVYQPNAVNTYTQIVNNQVENILGSVLAGSSGAGIYVVSAGGVVVTGNTIRNCCQQTTNRNLVPGAIGINGIAAPMAPIVVANNNIAETNFYDGITLSSISAGGIVDGNQIMSESTNVTGFPIYANGISGFAITNNLINQKNLSTQRCIFMYAQGIDCNNNIVSNNIIVGGNYSQIEFSVVGAFKHNRIIVVGNNLTGASSSSIPLIINNSTTGLVSSNCIYANTQVALLNNGSTSMLYSNNFVFSTGANAIQSVGVNSSSMFDKSNVQLNGVGSQRAPLNQGTGLAIETYDSAAPVAGTWAVGDRVEQNVPVAGQPKGWRCTAAGIPGTWVSEGNL